MKKQEKQWKHFQIDNFPLYDLEGEILSTIYFLQDKYDQYKESCRNMTLSIEGNVEEHQDIYIWGERLETDAEFEKRCAAEKKEKEDAKQLKSHKKAQEIETLRKLMAKYPDIKE